MTKSNPHCKKCKKKLGSVWIRLNKRFTRLEKILYCCKCDIFFDFDIKLKPKETMEMN